MSLREGPGSSAEQQYTGYPPDWPVWAPYRTLGAKLRSVKAAACRLRYSAPAGVEFSNALSGEREFLPRRAYREPFPGESKIRIGRFNLSAPALARQSLDIGR